MTLNGSKNALNYSHVEAILEVEEGKPWSVYLIEKQSLKQLQ